MFPNLIKPDWIPHWPSCCKIVFFHKCKLKKEEEKRFFCHFTGQWAHEHPEAKYLHHISVFSVSRQGQTSQPPVSAATATAHWPSPFRAKTRRILVTENSLTVLKQSNHLHMIGNVEKSGLSPSLLHLVLIEMVNDERLPPVRQNLLLLLSLCLLLCSLLTVLLDLTKKKKREYIVWQQQICKSAQSRQPFFMCVSACLCDNWPSVGRHHIAESCLLEPSSSWHHHPASYVHPPSPSSPSLPAVQIVRHGHRRKQTHHLSTFFV